ncbi:MAG: hypothetical protein ACTHKQ_05695 [Mesorhizobium sp.]
MNMRVRPARGSARPSTAAAQKTQRAFSWPAPTRGLVANGNIAVSQPGAAYILDNFRCTATGVIIRRGKQRHATLPLPVRSIFSYQAGAVGRLFASDDENIYDVTSVTAPDDILIGEDGDTIGEVGDYEVGTESLSGIIGYPDTNGKWIVIQTQSSDGSNYLIGANGSDPTFIYDGSEFAPQVDGGTSKLNFDAQTGDFAAGETVTGGTSGATATILRVISDGTDGTLWISDIVGGPFQDNEAVTDGGGGAATANGAAVAVPATDMSFPSGSTLTTADLSFVWAYKKRQFFLQKGTLDSWYLPVGQLAGELTRFSLGGVFRLGGSLVMGATWSRDTGSGLAAVCAFFSSEGEVAIYEGDNPGEANSWALVGVYRIGNPLGPKSIMDAGGDLITATDIGLVPLSRALATDYSILGTEAISESIIDLWNQEVNARVGGEWNVAFWSARQMVIVALPTINDQPVRWLVANAKTKGWSTYSGWDATCVHVFRDQAYFGSSDGAVQMAEVSGLDDGAPYTATCLPAFDQMGVAGYKNVSMLRAVWRGPYPITEKITDRADYDYSIPPAPSASSVSDSSVWGDAVWGQSEWGSVGIEKNVYQQWRVAYGGGEVHSPLIQLTSGSNAALDGELIRVDATFTTGDVVI